MSVCDGCTRRMEMCHTDCADYQADAVYKGGRRTSGRKAYKGWRKPGWKIRGGGGQ